MSDIIDLHSRRAPTHYTVNVSHYGGGEVEVEVLDLADDARSCRSAAVAMTAAAEMLDRRARELAVRP
jgi:hypothetical protein